VPFLPGSSYAYGFIVRDNPRTFGHSGGFPGVAGELRVYDDGDWTLVVLSNVSEGTGEVVAAWDALAGRLEQAKAGPSQARLFRTPSEGD
jgi:hypothetical protein